MKIEREWTSPAMRFGDTTVVPVFRVNIEALEAFGGTFATGFVRPIAVLVLTPEGEERIEIEQATQAEDWDPTALAAPIPPSAP